MKSTPPGPEIYRCFTRRQLISGTAVGNPVHLLYQIS
ncbi:uncharacterized protein METZ01_LOCUS499726, partial [marine metagenome]